MVRSEPAWAVLDQDKLAITDSRLPLFWLREPAKRYNATKLNGTGRLVRVRVIAVQARSKSSNKV